MTYSPGPGLSLPAPLASLSATAVKFLIGTFPVPPFLLPIYEAAGIDYGVPWEVLAAINEVESDYGRNLSTSSAGAVGWMQFLPSTWEKYGIDADGAGAANPYDPIDAIFAAARYLHDAGAQGNVSGAIFAYNHANWYVNSVELRAKLLQALPLSLVDGLTGLMQARFPVAGHLGLYASRAPTPLRVADHPAVALSAPAGAPVVAVADGRVVSMGDDPRNGRYITIEDSYGDRFTYSQLGSLEAVYPVLQPRVESAGRFSRELGLRSGATTSVGLRAATTSKPAGSATRSAAPGQPILRTHTPALAGSPLPTSTAASPTQPAVVKERLFAHPLRSASYAAGGQLQLQSSLKAYAAASNLVVGGAGASDYFSQPVHLRPGAFKLAPLRPGVAVAAGTILGRVGGALNGATGILLQIRPAGSKAPVDPSSIIAGWELLGRLTAGHAALAGAGETGAYGARNTSLGQVLLSSKPALEHAVLSDPRVTIDSCDRRGIAAGSVDWRALAVIEYLSYSGLAPTVPALVCGGTNGFGAALGTQVEITRLGGIPVAGHQGDGDVVDLAIRLLLGLQGSLRPSRVISLHSYPWETATIALPDHAARLDVDFPAPRAGALTRRLNTAQWQRLVGRLTQLDAQPAEPTAKAPATTRP